MEQNTSVVSQSKDVLELDNEGSACFTFTRASVYISQNRIENDLPYLPICIFHYYNSFFLRENRELNILYVTVFLALISSILPKKKNEI